MTDYSGVSPYHGTDRHQRGFDARARFQSFMEANGVSISLQGTNENTYCWWYADIAFKSAERDIERFKDVIVDRNKPEKYRALLWHTPDFTRIWWLDCQEIDWSSCGTQQPFRDLVRWEQRNDNYLVPKAWMHQGISSFIDWLHEQEPEPDVQNQQEQEAYALLAEWWRARPHLLDNKQNTE